VLLHLVDGTSEDPAAAYRTVRGELEAYDEALADKPEIVALSKCDAMTDDQIKAQVKALKKAAKKTPLVLSAHSRQGVPEALRALLDVIDEARAEAEPKPEDAAAWQP
jgi:GTP-binding protein